MSKVDLAEDAEIIRKYWNPDSGDVCVDVGFGPGPWTLRALELGAFVYAFDPSPHSHTLLMAEVHKHNFRNLAMIPVALWDSVGVQTLRHGNTVVPDEPTAADTTVPTTTLDAYFERHTHSWYYRKKVTHVNLDCEGAELRVLKGAEWLLVWDTPNLTIEVHQGVSRQEIRNFLDGVVSEDTDYDYAYEDVGGFLIARREKA